MLPEKQETDAGEIVEVAFRNRGSGPRRADWGPRNARIHWPLRVAIAGSSASAGPGPVIGTGVRAAAKQFTGPDGMPAAGSIAARSPGRWARVDTERDVARAAARRPGRIRPPRGRNHAPTGISSGSAAARLTPSHGAGPAAAMQRPVLAQLECESTASANKSMLSVFRQQ